MRSICEIIHNLRHPKVPRKHSTLTEFVRKIIAKVHEVVLVFRRKKATAAMSTIPVDEDMNLGLLQDIDSEEEHYEASTPSIQTELQKDSETETTPFYPDAPALVDEQVKKPKKGLMYCTICRDYYPELCRSPVEHGNKAEEYKYCQHCYKMGDHKTAACPNKPKLRVLVCSVCEDLYPCKNQEEHGNKAVEVNNFCCHCYRTGHLPQECTEEYDPTLTLNG